MQCHFLLQKGLRWQISVGIIACACACACAWSMIHLKGHLLADKNEVWEMEAFYLAQALVSYILILSPQKIIMGGGVMKQKQLFPLIRKNVKELLNGYVQKNEILEVIDDYIVYPGLGDEAGFVGSIALGKLALEQK